MPLEREYLLCSLCARLPHIENKKKKLKACQQNFTKPNILANAHSGFLKYVIKIIVINRRRLKWKKQENECVDI